MERLERDQKEKYSRDESGLGRLEISKESGLRIIKRNRKDSIEYECQWNNLSEISTAKRFLSGIGKFR